MRWENEVLSEGEDNNKALNAAKDMVKKEAMTVATSGGGMGPLLLAGGCAMFTFIFLVLGAGFALSYFAAGIGGDNTTTSDGGKTAIEGAVDKLTINGKEIVIAATEGKVGYEGATTGLGLGSYCTAAEKEWYMNMRWPAMEWKWNGLSRTYNDTLSLYGGVKVIVHNPKNGKSVVAVICESGPAPWTGSSWFQSLSSTCRASMSCIYDKATDSPPNYWTGYERFDPPEADGRVAGLASKPWNAVGATNNAVLQFGFAKDQSVAPGLIR